MSLSKLKRPPHQTGFTAIELLVVVAIVAILAALAAPSFTPLIERWRVRSTAENLASTVYFARSEAIKRGGSIAIDATGGWNTGWKVTHTQNSTTTDLQTMSAHSNLGYIRKLNYVPESPVMRRRRCRWPRRMPIRGK